VTGEKRTLRVPRTTVDYTLALRLNSFLTSLCTALSSFFLFPSGMDSRCCPYGPLSMASILITIVVTFPTWIVSFACGFCKAGGVGIGLWTLEDPLSVAFDQFTCNCVLVVSSSRCDRRSTIMHDLAEEFHQGTGNLHVFLEL
jgi:hypothetical protein